MKLSSPRTWLVVAAGVLLLAGGIVLYVIKNPPLPPGWMEIDCELFRVALPPGPFVTASDAPFEPSVTHRESYVIWHAQTPGLVIEITGIPVPSAVASGTTEEVLNWRVEKHMTVFDSSPALVKTCERIQWDGNPALMLKVAARPGEPTRNRYLIVLSKGWLHSVRISWSDEVVEKDIDFLFRTFRPK